MAAQLSLWSLCCVGWLVTSLYTSVNCQDWYWGQIRDQLDAYLECSAPEAEPAAITSADIDGWQHASDRWPTSPSPNLIRQPVTHLTIPRPAAVVRTHIEKLCLILGESAMRSLLHPQIGQGLMMYVHIMQ